MDLWRVATFQSESGATGSASLAATADAAEANPPHPLASAIVLLGASPRHRHLFIGDLDWAVLPPIALKQFRLFAKDGRPLAYGCWAFVSDEVDARLKIGQIKLKPNEWKSGENCWLIDMVAPLGGAGAFTKLLTENVLKDQTVRLSAAVQFAVKSQAARADKAAKQEHMEIGRAHV